MKHMQVRWIKANKKEPPRWAATERGVRMNETELRR